MAPDEPVRPPRSPAPLPARAGARPPPTPVRASLGDEKDEAAAVEGVKASVELEVDGQRWTASVGGKSRSGASLASVPILLVRFERSDGDGGPPREVWIVGGSVAGLTPLQLEAAFRSSEPAPAPWVRKPLFPEAGSRSGGDG